MSCCANRSKIKQKLITENKGVAPSSQGSAQGFGVSFLLPRPVVGSSGGPAREVAGAPCPVGCCSPPPQVCRAFAPGQPEALPQPVVAPTGQQQSREHRRGGISSNQLKLALTSSSWLQLAKTPPASERHLPCPCWGCSRPTMHFIICCIFFHVIC